MINNPQQCFQLRYSINHYIPGFEVIVHNLVMMQKGHSFKELKTKQHNVIRMVMELQILIKGRFPGQRNDCFANTEVNDVK